MLLPPELLSFLFLATTTAAFPQINQVANGTSLEPNPLPTPSDPRIEDPTDVELAPGNNDQPAFRVPGLPTADGWETSTANTPVTLIPEENLPRILTTWTPTVLSIQTNAIPKSTSNNRANVDDVIQPAPITRSYSEQAASAPNAPAQETPKNTLLLDIISRIAEPQMPPQAAPPATPVAGGRSEIVAQVTPGPKVVSGVNIIPAQAPETILPIGGVITAGSAILTLTPGLSTSFGTGDAATFIGITSNAAGQTLITVSSSGTAVTATVTVASATVTLPRSGFEASITQVARPGDWRVSNTVGGVAAPTSSKGAAVNTKIDSSWWMGLLLGVVGTGVMS
ncbi:hypothetical protein GQ44DRAFT_825527 [Phaeosphaeriaceae sp. PMI808]|nr:hypothetical protein GQ44DRAFT_825527 [Phaeosphaeriaceae sp. PMI808]